MIIEKTYIDKNGNEWKRAGYASPRRKDHPPVYRYIRMSDGARVRIPSTKLYCCQLSRANADDWFDVPTGTDEKADGGGAATIDYDHMRVGFNN